MPRKKKATTEGHKPVHHSPQEACQCAGLEGEALVACIAACRTSIEATSKLVKSCGCSGKAPQPQESIPPLSQP